MMKHIFLITGFTLMSLNQVFASSLLEGINIEDAKEIIKNAHQHSKVTFDQLDNEEKNYLYEYMLVKSLDEEVRTNEDSRTDEDKIDFYLSELGMYYDHRGKSSTVNEEYTLKAKEVYTFKADFDFKRALKGDESILSLINSLCVNKKLNNPYINAMVEAYKKNPEGFLSPSDALKALEGDHIRKIAINSLADAYQEAGRATLNLRKKYGMAPSQLNDSSFRSYVDKLLGRCN